MASKTTCPITRSEFKGKAPVLNVTIFGHTLSASARDFDSGSVGYYINGKVTVVVDGKPVVCQLGLNLTAVGSKDLPKETVARPAKAPATSAITPSSTKEGMALDASERAMATAKKNAEELAALEEATAPAAKS